MTPSAAALTPVIARLRAAGCVFAEEEAELLWRAAPTPAELAALVARRAGGEPLEHVLGWAQFCGVRVALDSAVFVPRRRTEFLVRRAAQLAAAAPVGDPPVVVDLCCGAGAVALGLHAAVPRVELHAVDIDPTAVQCARRNLAESQAHVYQGDLYAPLPDGLRGRVSVLVANAPYVPTAALATMPPEARLHEPRAALDGGVDGLRVLHRLLGQARDWLGPGGHVIVEASAPQAATLAAVAGYGLLAWVEHDDELQASALLAAVSPVAHRRAGRAVEPPVPEP